ncbi:MAG: ParB N-terminal domain-containing protein, partial [Sciscionella sp.]
METRDVPVGKLTRFPGNAKRGDVGEIAKSIRRTGQYRSLVVRDSDDGLIILAGNHTFDAVEGEKHKTVRCEVLRCT